MTNLVTAQGALLTQILDETFPVWHKGLSREAYHRWNRAQRQTEWGRAHLRSMALVDGHGAVLSSAKAYRYDVRMHDRAGWMCGIGAIFTPLEQRKHGHASDLVRRIVEQARADGALAAALFSEIGTRFYERLGFAAVPLDEVTVVVKSGRGAPAMLVRAGEERDLPAIAAMDEKRSRDVPFALRRDPAHFQYSLAKKRLLAGLGPAGERSVEFFVAEEGASAVAFVVLSVSARGWTLEDAGDRDPAGARLGAMLQVLLAREPSATPPLIRAWWPRAMPVPPQLALVDRTDAADVLMMQPLADVTTPEDPEDVFYWRSDAF